MRIPVLPLEAPTRKRVATTAADRNRVRLELDLLARARRQAFIDAHELDTCAGCGGDQDGVTHGCKNCWDRHLRRGRRGDPAYLAKERDRQRLARARRTTAQKARRQRQKVAA